MTNNVSKWADSLVRRFISTFGLVSISSYFGIAAAGAEIAPGDVSFGGVELVWAALGAGLAAGVGSVLLPSVIKVLSKLGNTKEVELEI